MKFRQYAAYVGCTARGHEWDKAEKKMVDQGLGFEAWRWLTEGGNNHPVWTKTCGKLFTKDEAIDLLGGETN